MRTAYTPSSTALGFKKDHLHKFSDFTLRPLRQSFGRKYTVEKSDNTHSFHPEKISKPTRLLSRAFLILFAPITVSLTLLGALSSRFSTTYKKISSEKKEFFKQIAESVQQADETGFVDYQKFERITIGKDYKVYRYINGENVRIDDQDLVDSILDGDYLKGSLGITKDKKKKGKIHKLIYVFQKSHSFCTRRARNFDPDHCHSFIVIGKGVSPNENRPHPILLTHATWSGIRTANYDYLKSREVTSVVFYRALDENLRNSIVDQAKRTAYIEDPKRRALHPESAEKKAGFRILDAFTSIFHNKKHKVCHKHGKRSKASNALRRRYAYQIADMLLSKQILDRSGRPKSLYCSAYASYVMQRGVLQRLTEDVSEEVRKAFTHDKNGNPYRRANLAKKLDAALKGKDGSEFGKRLYRVYSESKVLRLDGRYIMSGYVAKTLDKLS